MGQLVDTVKKKRKSDSGRNLTVGELQDLTYEFRLAQYRYLGFSPIEMVVMQGARYTYNLECDYLFQKNIQNYLHT
jgi:hypothetical protein